MFDKNYLGVKLSKKQKNYIEEFGKEFIKKSWNEMLFINIYPIKVNIEMAKDLQRKFIKYIEMQDNDNFYRKPSNAERYEEVDKIVTLLDRKLYGIFSTPDINEYKDEYSKFFIELLIYLEIISIA